MNISANCCPRRFAFSIPKISDGSLDFSFSGFKTAALRHIQLNGIKPRRPGAKISKIALDLVTSYQQVIIDTLVRQTQKASSRLHPRSILLVGGVACNSLLRKTFKTTFEEEPKRMEGREAFRVYYPSPMLTTDNAAMIAVAGLARLKAGGAARHLAIEARAQWPLMSLRAPGTN